MTHTEFVYWLNGFMELAEPTTLSPRQTQVIKDHLALTLPKVTPPRSLLRTSALVDELQGCGPRIEQKVC